MKKTRGTFILNVKPEISGVYTVVGPKEKFSELGKYYNLKSDDDKFGESTYEKAECKMLSTAISKVIEKSELKESDVSALISGDLLNQIISANFAARDFDVPFIGVYSACSTITECFIIVGFARHNIFIGVA